MKTRASLFAIFLSTILLSCPAWCQYSKQYNPFPVIKDFDTMAYPFWGGINSPKPSLLDLDHDSLTDLFVGEISGKLNYFHNTGSQAVPNWSPVSERFAGIDIGSWHLFADIDHDGDFDLFCDNHNAGMAFFRNQSVGSNISFVEVDSAYGGFAVAYNCTPAFADIDNDGDLDFFIGDLSGYLTFYRNVGTPGSPSFTFITSAYDSVLAFPGAKDVTRQPLHGFNNIRFADIDNDGDLDLFWGDIFNQNLYYFKNLGTPVLSNLKLQTEDYLPFTTQGFNHTPFADLDNDGDLDMILGKADGEDLDNLIFMRNTGTSSNALFVAENQTLVDCLDLGRNTVLTAGDLNGDGVIDLLVGNGQGRFLDLHNVGTPTAPSLHYDIDFYLGIDVGINAAPCLVDWDGDGDLDILVGNDDGKIQYWRNQGSPCLMSPVLITNQLAGIKVDEMAIPVAADLNGDGLLDLIVGEWDFNGFANVLLYRNTGTAGNPQLTLVTKTLLKNIPRDLTVPAVVDWDGDGKKDLVVGGRLRGLTLYKNTAPIGSFPDSNTLIPQVDTLPGSDDGNRIAPLFVDIDNDGDLDVFAGEEDGGINFWRHGGGTPMHKGDANGDNNINISDAVFLIQYIFGGGAAPNPTLNGDSNCDNTVNISDAVFLIQYIFAGGKAPCVGC